MSEGPCFALWSVHRSRCGVARDFPRQPQPWIYPLISVLDTLQLSGSMALATQTGHTIYMHILANQRVLLNIGTSNSHM